MAAPDLTRAISFRSTDLNTFETQLVDGVSVEVGCIVEQFDPSDVEIRQFTEPKIGRAHV